MDFADQQCIIASSGVVSGYTVTCKNGGGGGGGLVDFAEAALKTRVLKCECET